MKATGMSVFSVNLCLVPCDSLCHWTWHYPAHLGQLTSKPRLPHPQHWVTGTHSYAWILFVDTRDLNSGLHTPPANTPTNCLTFLLLWDSTLTKGSLGDKGLVLGYSCKRHTLRCGGKTRKQKRGAGLEVKKQNVHSTQEVGRRGSRARP